VMSRKLPIGVATTYRPGVSDMRDSPLRCCEPGCVVIVLVLDTLYQFREVRLFFAGTEG